MLITSRNFVVADARLRDVMKSHGRPVTTETWQGRDIAARPDMQTVEVLNVSLEVKLTAQELEHYRMDCRPNLPWADNHFLERVGGEPLNPPPSFAWWPHGQNA